MGLRVNFPSLFIKTKECLIQVSSIFFPSFSQRSPIFPFFSHFSAIFPRFFLGNSSGPTVPAEVRPDGQRQDLHHAGRAGRGLGGARCGQMRRDAGNTWRSDSRTGWWFGTLNIKHIDTHIKHLVGGLQHILFP